MPISASVEQVQRIVLEITDQHDVLRPRNRCESVAIAEINIIARHRVACLQFAGTIATLADYTVNKFARACVNITPVVVVVPRLPAASKPEVVVSELPVSEEHFGQITLLVGGQFIVGHDEAIFIPLTRRST